MKQRCSWAQENKKMKLYHDTIWGVPVYDDQRLFRKLVLDINQAGLSWQTILNKENHFDAAFDDFDIKKVAYYDERKIEELMNNPGIIRNRRKIEAAIYNAQKVIEIQNEFGSFSNYLWSFNAQHVLKNSYQNQLEIPTTNELSDRITKELKKRGFKFVGSTIIYAFLEAVGIINDHVTTCFRYDEIK
ncbi:DNA-3-methyladenine glycosylase I [Enterococcus haemoperoxidus ATCC BAA-382]|uniref:DNA-3-methyladenine glycosylase I n=1 Tax=Enterococcus haemoperoxidus ATCC BAA-382 TaxID=1158608 RepID=R2TET3_9ENTE|nr:DNA-3-methyladenine glycosylase I [Enterococcus haemoperoxidus]EOH98644.1 DNA-3-methyladenine glycosylase I [Enterococcus haemoperoxidus ATCC BAA-382]EOT62173.1 DNA-3-methyladenine glycosylase I [Enterococcus haemoperoxidus ATCC BAA-382]OJG55746.1 DNA-3-methyladenine glycosylase I [Enterococcus haemoperoxidus]